MGGSGRFVVVAVVAVAAGSIVLQPVSARADLPGPERARRIITSFVEAFEPCSMGNDQTTGAISLPACHPAVPVDATCRFGPEGKGTGRAFALDQEGTSSQDVRITGRFVGLDAGCEGETLCVSATLVVSTVGCQSGDADGCTMQTLTNFPIGVPPTGGCGVVQNGTVALRTTVNEAFDAAVLNSRTSIQVRGIGIRRVSSVNSPAPSAPIFESGLLTR